MSRFKPVCQRVLLVLLASLLFATSTAHAELTQQDLMSEGVSQFDLSADQCAVDGTTQSVSISMPTDATAEDRIAQTFMVGFDASISKDTITKVVTDTHIGGIYLLGTKDAAGAGFTKDYFNTLGKAAGVPLMVASDEEGGIIHRFAYSSDFPSAKAMGSLSNDKVEGIGKSVGQQLSSDGVTVDLAPVLDIDNGKHDGAISANDRAFSDDTNTITAKAGAFANGLQESGVMPVFKHFPGLGNATPDNNTDAHKASSPSLSTLKANDLKPYAKLAGQYGAGVMLSNEYVTGLDNKNPASESPNVVSLLRKDYNFNGLIMTDDLKPASTYDGQGGLPQSIAAAEAAGVNMPLFTFTTEADITAAIAAVKTQTSDNQITTSVDKIIAAKGGADANNSAPTTTATAASAGCCSTGDATSFATSSGKNYVPDLFTFFTGKGLSAVQAAAIIGNLQHESASANVDPLADQSHGRTAWLSSDSYGYGIAQWTSRGRQLNLIKYAGEHLTNGNTNALDQTKDFNTQLGYFWKEATGPYAKALAKLKTIDDLNQATEQWMTDFEGPSDPQLESRQNYAKGDLATYNGGSPQAYDASAGSSSAGCDDSSASAGFTAENAGKYSKVIDCPADTSIKCTKSIYYSQFEGPWAGTAFGGGCGTIGECGCGVTSIAMAIATLNNDPKVTPGTLIADWQSSGLATHSGTSWSIPGWKAVGKKYGLNFSQITAHAKAGMSDSEIQAIVTAVMGGALVGVSGIDPTGGNYAKNPTSPFTSGGHFILIRGYDPVKKSFLISDPNNNVSKIGNQSTGREWGWSMLSKAGESAWKLTK